MNGAVTGMEVTAPPLRPILQVLLRALTASTVVAAGTAMPGAAVCLTGTATHRAMPTTTSVCASSSQFNLKKQEKEENILSAQKASQIKGWQEGRTAVSKNGYMQIKCASLVGAVSHRTLFTIV